MKNVRYVFILSLVLAFVACSKPSELHTAMEDMGDAMKTMMKSDDLATVKTELQQFSQALDIAKQQKVKPEHQDDFDQGMQDIAMGVQQLESAVQAGSLDQAKNILKKMHDTQEDFHKKLGVED